MNKNCQFGKQRACSLQLHRLRETAPSTGSERKCNVQFDPGGNPSSAAETSLKKKKHNRVSLCQFIVTDSDAPSPTQVS